MESQTSSSVEYTLFFVVIFSNYLPWAADQFKVTIFQMQAETASDHPTDDSSGKRVSVMS
jgi:hypothetical protein